MGSVVLDTGVIIAFLDNADAHHDQVITELRERRAGRETFLLSMVTVAELMSSRRQARRARAVEMIETFGESGLIAVDRDVAERAGEIRNSSPSIALPDALVAATADVVGAQVLLTTDRKLARLNRVQYVGTKRR